MKLSFIPLKCSELSMKNNTTGKCTGLNMNECLCVKLGEIQRPENNMEQGKTPEGNNFGFDAEGETSNSISDFGFKLRKRLPKFDEEFSIVDDSENLSDKNELMSPSPIVPASEDSFTTESLQTGSAFLSKRSNKPLVTRQASCGKLSMAALDQLFKNPFALNSPQIAEMSPA